MKPTQSDNADLVQPGLIQLQPSLEEIMASLGSESNGAYTQVEPLGDSLPNVSPDSCVALANADSAEAPSSSNSRSLRDQELLHKVKEPNFDDNFEDPTGLGGGSP
uniref:Uncharacterized protein n=1 Tax=Romanomermis culicivorax TaxID=13658 RepID=A0A915KUM9_ROMCU